MDVLGPVSKGQCDNYNRKLVQMVQQHVSYMNLSGYDVGHVTIFS